MAEQFYLETQKSVLGRSISHYYYDHVKNKYDGKSKLSFTGTDSLMHEIKTEDVIEGSNKEMFDFSNYSTKSKYHDNSNKLAISNMKDDSGRDAIK